MTLKWNFQRGWVGGGWVQAKKTFHGRGMDIFWNNTIKSKINNLIVLV